jgi:hypothetical protein
LTDTERLKRLERYWRDNDEPPVDFDGIGSFTPRLSGTYQPHMTLREALDLAFRMIDEEIDFWDSTSFPELNP